MKIHEKESCCILFIKYRNLPLPLATTSMKNLSAANIHTTKMPLWQVSVTQMSLQQASLY